MNTATLARDTITVDRIIPAKGPGKSAALKTTDGRMFGVWPDKLAIYHEGASYEVDFTEKVSGGVTYRDIKAGRMLQGAPEPARGPVNNPPRFLADERRAYPLSADATHDGRALAMAGRQSYDAPAPREATRAPAKPAGDYYKQTSPRDGRRMFLCSQMNALINSRQVTLTVEGIASAIDMLAQAYDSTLGQED